MISETTPTSSASGASDECCHGHGHDHAHEGGHGCCKHDHGGEAQKPQQSARGVEHAHVIDLIADDAKTGEVTLIMLEERPWDGSELRLFQLQEKINTYLSFALDGEMAEVYPQFVSRKLRLQLDCVGMPGSDVVGFLSMVRDQIAFQGINFEVRVMGERGCGEGCGCVGHE